MEKFLLKIMKSKQVVVFDLDDTLYNEIDFLKSAYNEIAQTISKEINVESDVILNDMLFFYNKRLNSFDEILKKYKSSYEVSDLIKVYRNHKPNLFLTKERKVLLDSLKTSKISMGIITDGRSNQQRNKLEALNVLGYFSEIIISEEFGSEKPNMNNFKYFEDKFGDVQYYYIGDNVKKDFVSPNKLNWITICLLDKGVNIHNQNFDLPIEFLPKYKVNNFKEISSLINL